MVSSGEAQSTTQTNFAVFVREEMAHQGEKDEDAGGASSNLAGRLISTESLGRSSRERNESDLCGRNGGEVVKASV